MNNAKRNKLREAIRFLSSASNIVDSVCDAEQDCIDNMPEGLQGTDRYERMEDAVDLLNDAMEKLDEAKDHIQSAINK